MTKTEDQIFSDWRDRSSYDIAIELQSEDCKEMFGGKRDKIKCLVLNKILKIRGFSNYNEVFANKENKKNKEGILIMDESKSEGIKYDDEKPDYSLIPPAALEDTVKVLTFGANKYDRENWRQVPNAKQRYFAALMRHAFAVLKGEVNDPESGLSHWAHVMCNALFLYELYKK